MKVKEKAAILAREIWLHVNAGHEGMQAFILATKIAFQPQRSTNCTKCLCFLLTRFENQSFIPGATGDLLAIEKLQ